VVHTPGDIQFNYLIEMKKSSYFLLVLALVPVFWVMYSKTQPSCPTFERAYYMEFSGYVDYTFVAKNNHGYKMIKFKEGVEVYFPYSLEYSGFYEMLKSGMYIEKPSKSFDVLIVTLNGDTILHTLEYNCKEFPEL